MLRGLAALVLLLALSAFVVASTNNADRLAERTLRDSLAARYPDVAFEIATATYDPETRCYIIPFRAVGIDVNLTAFVRGNGVVDDYEDTALHDLSLSLELSAQCEQLAKQVLDDDMIVYDELIAALDVPRGKYAQDMSYHPALVDEPIAFRVMRLAWSGDDTAEFSRWCDEVYHTLQLSGFPIGSIVFQAFAGAEFSTDPPVFEKEM